MSQNNKVIQHYVPKCYLKKFGIDRKTIFKFSKKSDIYSLEQIKDCCQYDEFYTLVNRPIPKYIEENILDRREENNFGPLLKSLRTFSKNYLKGTKSKLHLDLSNREILSRLIAVQYIRGPRYRHFALERERKSDIANVQIFCNSIGFEIESIELAYEDSNIHGDLIASERFIKEHINYIFDKDWTFLFSNNSFITSDEPVTIIKQNLCAPILPHEGLKYFKEIYFPINSHLLLKISRPNNSRLFIDEGVVQEISDEELSFINGIIRYNSREFYFSDTENPLINGKTQNEKP